MQENINQVISFENNMPVESNAYYSVNNVSGVLHPAGDDNALVYEVISSNNQSTYDKPRSGYSIALMRKGYIVAIAITCAAAEFAANKNEFIAIIKSLSPVKYAKSNTNAASSLPKLPADAVCPFLPVCDGYTYSYTKQDPYLKSTLTHTTAYEKAEDKIVKGKRFRGFKITSTNPEDNNRNVFYNYENGMLIMHTEQTNYLGGLNGMFTTVIELKTDLQEGGNWTDNVIMEGGSKVIKNTILEKDVSVVIGGKSYEFVTIVERKINATTIEGRNVESVQKVYYAKGIGKIKIEDGYAGGDVFETVMTSHSIPGQ
ncbi:MAG TPA: hypothetical protein VFW07_14270 [Parafilimonas sp.]|nr:hypothetical protein [Parafilimonas sp.]